MFIIPDLEEKFHSCGKFIFISFRIKLFQLFRPQLDKHRAVGHVDVEIACRLDQIQLYMKKVRNIGNTLKINFVGAIFQELV